MNLRAFSQIVFLLISVDFHRCTETGVKEKEPFYLPNSDRVLENGRIISQPIEQPMPVDQRPLPVIQSDDTNPKALKYVAHGDILVPIEPVDSKRTKRKIISERNRYGMSNRWPGGIIPYEFAPGTDYRVQQNVLTAIQHWHDWTCLRFEPYNVQRHRNFICRITIEDTGDGCATFIGYQPGYPGTISSYSVFLPLVCPLGSAIHELGHVIGFYHEMSRVDRDREINIFFNRMSLLESTQYDIMQDPQPGYYGQPYDLGSIMHYRSTGLMVARDDQRTFLMGQRVSLSFLDTKLANLAYQCGEKCSPKPVCDNEGYVNQFCQCTCPDGFYGDRCQYLQGYSAVQSRLVLPSSTPASTTTTATTATTTTTTVEETVLRWLEWTGWSNCSEPCGSGIRVRTRLCSDTTIDGSADPCAALGGSSFEIEACQSSQCKKADVIVGCTFDLNDENCPFDKTNVWSTRLLSDEPSVRPTSDHTRGDGHYLIVNRTGVLPLEVSNDESHCLQFWYSAVGTSKKTLKIGHDETIVLENNLRGEFWKLLRRNISTLQNGRIIFGDESSNEDYHHLIIDDLSITTGTCDNFVQQGQTEVDPKMNGERSERKRRQASQSCSQVIDLMPSNPARSITSPNYPNLYANNVQCYLFIRAPAGYRIGFQFSDFNIASYSRDNCDDSVEVRYYHLGQPGPRYCGTGANTNNLRFTSQANQMMIVLRSNENYSGRGFNGQASLVR